MNHLPECVSVYKFYKGRYILQTLSSQKNETFKSTSEFNASELTATPYIEYEKKLDEYIEEMKKNSIPLLFTKNEIQKIVNERREYYNILLNYSNCSKDFIKIIKDFIKNNYELREPFIKKTNKTSISLEFILLLDDFIIR